VVDRASCSSALPSSAPLRVGVTTPAQPTREELERAEERKRVLQAQLAELERREAGAPPSPPAPTTDRPTPDDPAAIGGIVARLMASQQGRAEADDHEPPEKLPVTTEATVGFIAEVRRALGDRIGQRCVWDLIGQVGEAEVRRQLEWWPKRDIKWARTPAASFTAHCRDREGPPSSLADATAEGRRKAAQAAEDAERAAYDKWVTRGTEKALRELDDDALEVLKAAARERLGALYTGEDTHAFRGALRTEVLKSRKALTFDEWRSRRQTQQGEAKAAKRGAA
jgi:hypothetical protein